MTPEERANDIESLKAEIEELKCERDRYKEQLEKLDAALEGIYKDAKAAWQEIEIS